MKANALTVAVLCVAASLTASTTHAAALAFSTVFTSASSTVNQLRSVALSDDEASVYTGYIQTSGNRQVDRHGTTSPYGSLNTFASGGDQPKAIAVDDRGNVFIANRGSGTTSSTIRAMSSTLVAGSTTAATTPVIGGLDIQKSGATYYAYAVYESAGLIQRYNVTNTGAMALDNTFNGTGSYNIPGASDLRGVQVLPDGTIYTASRGDSKVYKISADLSTVTTSATINRAFDLALYDGKIYTTSYDGTNSYIAVLNSDLTSAGTITVGTLDGLGYTRASNAEGFGGIDIDSTGHIWMADENFGTTGGTQDRLLVSSVVPEPATLAALAGAGAVALRRRRK